jgi:MoaA/NifB/PqqE/SkfB family radical SAM enzyme
MNYTPAIKLTLTEQYRKFINSVLPGFFVANMEISPSGVCKAGCPWCFYRAGHSGLLIDSHKCDAAIKELVRFGAQAITWSGGGEPTAHPDLHFLIESNPEIAHGLFTNALYPMMVKPKLLNWVRITYTPHLNKTDVKQFQGSKKIGMVFNWTGNQDQLLKALALAEDTGMRYLSVRPALNIKGFTTDIDAPKIKHPLLDYQDYKFDAANHKHPYQKCYGYHFVPFIKENGDVFACYYMTADDYRLGNIYEKPIYDIMRNAPRCLPVISSCQVCCKNNEINTLLNMAMDVEDKEFA